MIRPGGAHRLPLRQTFELWIASTTASVTSFVVAVAADVRRQDAVAPVTCLHRRISRVGGLGLAEMLEHLRGGPERGDRVGDALAGDVEGRAVDRLEHRREAALGIDIGGRRDAEAAGQRAGEIGQDVGVQVRRDDRVEALRLQHHAHRHGVDQHLVPGDVREFLRDLGGDLVPHHHAVALRVRLRDDRQELARARLRQPEGVAHDAGDADAGEDRRPRSPTSSGRPRCARPPWPEYSPSEFSRTITQSRSPGPHLRSGERDARQDPGRPHVGVLVEALADRQAQAPERDVVGHVRRADRAEDRSRRIS